MKYRIPVKDEISRAEKRRRFLKWLIFIFIVLFFYVLMRTGLFTLWQPVFLIPLTVAVSMYESELSSSIFALFCGYMIDIAFGFIFGFSVIWLMAVCLMSSLLVKNLIRVNLFNFMATNAAAVFIEFSMDYLFNVVIWSIPGKETILAASIIPTAVSTIITAPLIYYLIRSIERRFNKETDKISYYDNSDNKEQGDKE